MNNKYLKISIKIKNLYLKKFQRKTKLVSVSYGIKNIDITPFEKIIWDMPITPELAYNCLVLNQNIKYMDRCTLFARFFRYNQLDEAMKTIPIPTLIYLIDNCEIKKIRNKDLWTLLPFVSKTLKTK